MFRANRVSIAVAALFVLAATPALACDNPFGCESSDRDADRHSRDLRNCDNPFNCEESDDRPSTPTSDPPVATEYPAMEELRRKVREHNERIRCFGCPN
jgi:hypothetical protein